MLCKQFLVETSYPFHYNNETEFLSLINKYHDQIGGIVIEAIRNMNPEKKFIDTKKLAPVAIDGIHQIVPGLSDYAAIHYLINHENFPLAKETKNQMDAMVVAHQFNSTKTQAEEILQRYSQIREVMRKYVVEPGPLEKKIFSDKLELKSL